MSTTFSANGGACRDRSVNVNTAKATALLRLLDLEEVLDAGRFGELRAVELGARCRRLQWGARERDLATAALASRTASPDPASRWVDVGFDAGSLARTLAELAALCEAAVEVLGDQAVILVS